MPSRSKRAQESTPHSAEYSLRAEFFVGLVPPQHMFLVVVLEVEEGYNSTGAATQRLRSCITATSCKKSWLLPSIPPLKCLMFIKVKKRNGYAGCTKRQAIFNLSPRDDDRGYLELLPMLKLCHLAQEYTSSLGSICTYDQAP